MSLVAAADPAATRTMAHRLVQRVHRVSKSILRAPADADDAAQQSLIEIISSAKNYRGDSSLERWSDRIVVRTSIRFAKGRQKHGARNEDESELDTLPAEGGLDDSLADAAPRPVKAYLAELPEAQRSALVLRHVMGYSINEIADLTEASPNTVKDRLLRGTKEMRRLIRRDVAIGVGERGGSA
ncbi:MAG: RNA polymerase sigma factor [Myxococcales bacterium]|nr:RNA polymerase sigma factor [Myxococcales bacterium]